MPGSTAGGLARWAMAGGLAWYLPLAVLSFCLAPVAAVLCSLVLVQTFRTDPQYPGRTAAIVSSCVGLGIGGLSTMSMLANLAS